MSAPDLGPICPGDASILEYSCTHYTSGLEWPAFDTGWTVGRDVIAPERVEVYDNTSSAQGGDAFYARGSSGLLYWIAHIAGVPKQGATFSKGARMTEIAQQSESTPHVHLAINATALLGHHLESGKNYSGGAPTIGAQLAGTGGKEDPVQDWVADWVDWYVLGQHRDPPAKRPAGAPKEIPADVWDLEKTVVGMLNRHGADSCWQKWNAWKDGGEKGKRPECAPETIPEEWHEARARVA